VRVEHLLAETAASRREERRKRSWKEKSQGGETRSRQPEHASSLVPRHGYKRKAEGGIGVADQKSTEPVITRKKRVRAVG